MGTPKPLLSLCMIVKNESLHLSRSLESIRDIVDEMIVVDTGSKDRTPEIARGMGAALHRIDWQDDFSLAKNAALERASGEWILVMDADEEWEHPAETRDTLREQLQQADVEALQVLIRNSLPENDLAQFHTFYLTRIFRNRPAFRYAGCIHEQIRPAIERCGGKILQTEFSILHHGYARENVQGGEKRNCRNLRLLKTALRQDPGNAYLLYHLGLTYKDMGNSAQAVEVLENARSHDKGRLSPEIRDKLFAKLAQLALARDDYVTAGKYARQSMRLNAQNLTAQYIVSLSSIYSGEFMEALHGFEQILNHPNTNARELGRLEQIIQFCRQRLTDKVMN